jgi:hypothetical protein
MKTPNIAILSVAMLVAGSIALSGCGKRSATNPTMISYSQVGVCKSYATQTGNEEKSTMQNRTALSTSTQSA